MLQLPGEMRRRMKEITLDIKSLIAVMSVIAILGGFYYTTIYRLGALEAQVQSLSEQVNSNSSAIKNLRKKSKVQK